MIDTHVHLWDPALLRYPWLKDLAALNKSFLVDDYMTAAGGRKPDGIVFVQAGTAEEDFLAEAEWVASMEHPLIKGIVAGASIEEGEGVRGHLEALTKIPLVKGVRRLIQDEPDDAFCMQPSFLEGLRCLPDYDFSFDICIYHRQLANAIKMVEACPEVDFILDHLGKPGVKLGLHSPWREEIREMARLENVVCKISGLITEADHEDWKAEELKPYVHAVLEAFGPDRVFFGSDWPVLNLASDLGSWHEMLKDIDFGDACDRMKFFESNAQRVYKLEHRYLQPRIEEMRPKTLVGAKMRMSLAENKTRELWQSFMLRRGEVQNRVSSDFISMQVYDEAFDGRFSPQTEFEKWAVVEVKTADPIPDGMQRFDLAGGRYLVFDSKGPASRAREIMTYIYGEWIPQSGIELDKRPSFEVLPEGYNPADPEAKEEIWIAIR